MINVKFNTLQKINTELFLRSMKFMFCEKQGVTLHVVFIRYPSGASW